MKIRAIRFLNLNSLRGEHEICFDAAPLSDSGLFAITGPTGAGKTTILDAITLGLYGRVNRHDRDLPAEIMTRHTGEAYSEVTFEARNEIYRAKWQVYRSRRKPDGNIQPVKMELCRVADGIPFDLKSNEVPGKVSELCGLDYNQFLRSVMLSQGEFTRFLKASENERSELLERITDTAIYSDISRLAYRRAADEKNNLKLLRSELSGQELLAPEILREYETGLEENRKQETALKENRTQTEAQLYWLQNLQKLTRKQDETRQALQNLEENAAKNQPDFEKLAQHNLAQTFRPDLVQLNGEQAQLNGLQNRQLQLEQQLPALKTAVASLAEQAEKARQEQGAADKILKEIGPLLDQVLQQDAAIESLRRQFQKDKETYQAAKADSEKDAAETEQHRKTVAELTQKLTALQSWLSEHAAEKELAGELPVFERYLKDLQEIIRDGQKWKKEKITATQALETAGAQQETAGKKLTELALEKKALQQEISTNSNTLAEVLNGTSEAGLENAVQELPERLNLLEKLQQLSSRHQTCAHKTQTLKSQQTELASSLKPLQQLQPETEEKLTAGRELLQQYQEILDFQKQVQTYEEARKQLQPGCECPLCGSTVHPFAQGHQPQFTDAETKRNAQQKTVLILEQKRSELASELAVLQTKVKAAGNALTENQQLQESLQTEFREINGKLNTTFDLSDPRALELAIPACREELSGWKMRLEKLKKARQQAQVLTEKQYRLQEETLRETSTRDQAAERIQVAETTLQNAEKELKELLEQYNQIAAEASAFVMRFGLSFSAENGSVLLQQLQAKSRFYAEQTEAVQATQLRLTEAESRRREAEATMARKQQQLDMLQEKLTLEHRELSELKTERENQFGTKDPATERTRLTAACEQKKQETESANSALNRQTENLRVNEAQQQQLQLDAASAGETAMRLRSQLEEKLALHGIGSVESLTGLFLPEETANQLTQTRTELEKLLTETRQTLADTIAELQAEQTKNLTTETVELLNEKLQQTDREISAANQQIGRLTQILQRESELQEKHRSLAERIEKQQKEAARWENLSELIGSESGKKFSKFAQGLTLAKLVTLANRHLRKLNDRYQLQKAPGSDLELQMIDTYQADAVRSVNTLSGGESFLVSLALALGLSDLASHKTQIDSLFIDEGFGTLDAETLDVAVTALENLQASGKMIGIISHVEALKERIGTQILIKKLSGGVSRIEVSAFAGVEF